MNSIHPFSKLPSPVLAVWEEQAGFFRSDSPVWLARAPGRLDVMGGIADYSGSVVLEYPLAEAAWAFLQPRTDGLICVRSALLEGETDAYRTIDYEMATNLAMEPGAGRPLDQVSERFRRTPDDRWAAYLLGCWSVLASVRPDKDLSGGASLLLVSEVPPGAGVSSSAAIEVSTMRGITSAYDIQMDGLELARLCQVVENRVVGAPCGIMDQVTSAMGRKGQLLALRCQPHDVLGTLPLPTGFIVVGLDSGVKHTVSGSPYTRARVAAFMGHRILTADMPEDPWNGYLANLSVERYRNEWRDALPEQMTGAAFIAQYQTTIDPITRVDPNQTYRIRACVDHPIYENDRVERFMRWIETAVDDAELLPDKTLQRMIEAGNLMMESHASYSENVELGSSETDFLVDETRERGVNRGLLGAKITGGGCGGTVAILMRDNDDARAALEEVQQSYANAQGFLPRAFTGSSPGAMEWTPWRLEPS